MTTIHYLAKAVKKWDLEAIQFLEFTITDYQENVYVHIDTLTAVAGVIVDEEDMRNANSFAKELCTDVLNDRISIGVCDGNKIAKEYNVQIRPDEGTITIELTDITISRRRNFLQDISLDPDDVI